MHWKRQSSGCKCKTHAKALNCGTIQDLLLCMPVYSTGDMENPDSVGKVWPGPGHSVQTAYTRQDHISNPRGRHLLPQNWGLILKFTLLTFQRWDIFLETSIIKYAYFYFMIFGRIWVTHVSGMTLSILLYRILKVHFICNLLHSST